jgi:hypothetical protein
MWAKIGAVARIFLIARVNQSKHGGAATPANERRLILQIEITLPPIRLLRKG